MTEHFADSELRRASEIEASYQAASGLYLLGSLERGVTVYNQQLRAHNLVWALWEMHRADRRAIGRVAVVGGGIAGLSTAACILARFGGGVPVTLFERLWDLCPIQQGADARWLHPRIYDWPTAGSRAPSASVPVLNWSEGRASDVARVITREFGEYCRSFAGDDGALSVVLGLRHFQMNAETREIEWIGSDATREGTFFQLGASQGNSARFDTIIVTAGFGLERATPQYATSSYWRNEQFGQPILDGTQRRYVVSGFGDGALVDLCRLTIERFRQDTIIYELFGSNPEEAEALLLKELDAHRGNSNIYDLLLKIEGDLLQRPLQELSRRLRKDTAVALHISGASGKISSFHAIFGPTSSFLNRLLTFLLFKCGAFSIGFGDLKSYVERHGAPDHQVLCRHGADTVGHLRAMFANYESIERRVECMAREQKQVPLRLWKLGAFPVAKRKDSDVH